MFFLLLFYDHQSTVGMLRYILVTILFYQDFFFKPNELKTNSDQSNDPIFVRTVKSRHQLKLLSTDHCAPI